MGQPIDVALTGDGLDTCERGDVDASRSIPEAREPATCEPPGAAQASPGGKFHTAEQRRAAGEFDATDALSVSEIVSKLVQGTLDPESVSPERRRECVAVLFEEGYNISDTAAAMRVSERTIYRDRDELRRDRAIKPTLTFGDELVGDYFEHTQTAIQRLRKLTRESTTPAAVKVRAEEAAARLYERLVKTLRQLKYIEPGDRRLQRMREEEEAERVSQRLAEGSSIMAEVAGPRMAALMGMTPTRRRQPAEAEHTESASQKVSPRKIAPTQASSPKAALPEAAPQKSEHPKPAPTKTTPPASESRHSECPPSQAGAEAALHRRPGFSTNSGPSHEHMLGPGLRPPVAQSSPSPKSASSESASEEPSLIETFPTEARLTLPPYPELPKLRILGPLPGDAGRLATRSRDAQDPGSPNQFSGERTTSNAPSPVVRR